MNTKVTVEPEVTPSQDATDLAPRSGGEQLDVLGNHRHAQEQSLVNLEGRNRKKTWGEALFDWGTYGGVALLGNEASSLVITTQAEHGLTKNLYQKGINYFKSLKGKKFVPNYVSEGHLMRLLIAVIGGMTVVPFVKYLEDHKGEIVRKIDRKHYGERADTDPEILEAHKEMDEAPKQTWGSLWQGRAITVLAAIGMDWLVGCKDAQSNKLFKNSPGFQKVANMDRLAGEISSGVMNGLKITEAKRPAWDRWLKQGSWLLIFSSTLTVLFYASSKIFATRREQKIERREEARRNGNVLRDADGNEITIAQPDASREKPQPQVTSATRENTIIAAPQLAQSI